MERITDKHLTALCERLNKLTGSPETPYSSPVSDDPTKPRRMRANVGNYHISHAYGGVCLHRMSNETGGVTTPLVYGHVPKRELYNAMHAFIAGFETGTGDRS